MADLPGDERTIDLGAALDLPPGKGQAESPPADTAPAANGESTVFLPGSPDATIEQAPEMPANTAVICEGLGPVKSDQTIEHDSSPRQGFTVDHRPGVTAADQIAVVPAKRGETPAPIPKVAGYEIVGVLGRGGMGVVYKARQEKLNRLVALKMVLGGGHASPLQLARFFTEAEAVARLQHPNIVQIYEVGEFEGLPYFSLEYVSGGTLAEKIDRKPQPPREAAAMIELLAYAMAAAHERGIIHRDLKPANVLLDGDGLPKITDFGLAKQIENDSGHTKSGTLMGTPSYMSPEQASGETHEIGILSDLYSLGAMFYELLTGRPPFVGATMLETVLQVRNQEPVPPSRLQPKCPRDLETICMKCLQKKPQQRYASCEALAADLHRFLAGEPIAARPVGWIERGWRWCQRNPRVATLSAALGVLLLTVIVSVGIVVMRVSREREAVTETGKIAGERLKQATQLVAAGNYGQAQDLLRWSDPMLGHADLADVRTGLETLGAQVDVYAEFRQLLDNARFASRFGSRRQKEEGREYCHKLLALYDEIEGRRGRGASGLPPLDDQQQQLFKEDVFEALLTAAQVEQSLAPSADEAAQRQAALKSLDWLERAEQVLPGTRALHVHRAPCWAKLGNTAASQADRDKAKSIEPTSAVDHFWHGFANHVRGEEAWRKNDAKGAADFYHAEIAEYAAFLQQRPDHFWGYFNWANAHVTLGQRGDLYDALIGFTACIRLRPDFPWPYNNRGTVHLRLQQPHLAAADFTEALAQNQNYTEAHANRGLAHLALKKLDLALEDFNKAIALNPDYTSAYAERAEIHRQRKQDALAVQDYTRLLALTDNKQPILEKRAAAYRALGRTSEAAGDFGALIKLNPKNFQAYSQRAELRLSLGNHAAAKEDFTSILELAPQAAPIWRARAIVNWQNLKDFDAALADFERFAQLKPKDAEPHRCIGAILLGSRQYLAALDALDKATALRPGYPEAIRARAQVYLRQGQSEKALTELDPLVARLPEGPPETLNVRAGVYLALGKLNEAAADYGRMIELKPQEPEAYVCLARIHDMRGRSAEAAACFERLVKASPNSKWALVRRAAHRRDHGDFEAALADCDQAASLAPTWRVPALVRASVTAARGQPLAAIAEAERVLGQRPLDDGHVLFASACVWSLAAGASKDPAQSKLYADRAIEFLASTLDKGFHDLTYPEHNRLPDEAALTPIRELPRARALLMGHAR